jgi:hypothetical protein
MSKELVFNISFPKTGTTSVENALSKLGYNVARGHWDSPHTNYLYGQYMDGNIDELIFFVNHSKFNAFSDGPWFSPRLYERLSKEFPEAKFLLCIRNSDQWFKSLKDMILTQYQSTPTDVLSIYHNESYGFYRWFNEALGDNLDDKTDIMAVYDKHNQDAVSFLDKERLLVIKTEELSWPPLCEFLVKTKPPGPFPRKNVRREKNK